MSQPIQVSSISIRRRLPFVRFNCPHCQEPHRIRIEHTTISPEWTGNLIGYHHTTITKADLLEVEKIQGVKKVCKKLEDNSEVVQLIIPLNTPRTTEPKI